MRSMSAGSSMLAITLSRPLQRRQVSIAIENTRLSRTVLHALRHRVAPNEAWHLPAELRELWPRPGL
jgi:hypothetical protein